MKTPGRQFLTPHRRQRFILWALAMLAWMASVIAGVAPTRRHLNQRGAMSIHRLARRVKQLILLRAADIAGIRPNMRPLYVQHGRDMRRRHIMRSMVGSRLRRALAHRDAATRISILIDALTHLDAWAARFVKPIARGFRRLWAIAPAPMPAALILEPPAHAPACADSS